MRSFQLLFWIIFFIFFVLITLGSLQCIKILLARKHKFRFTWYYLVIAFIIIVSILFLYIWPGDIRTSNKYGLYYVFNGILFIDVIFKIPLTLLFILSIPFYKKELFQSVFSWIGLILSVGLSLIIFFGIIVGKNSLTKKNIEIEFSNLPKSFDGIKIVQISDLHMGSFVQSKYLLKKVQKQVEIYKPDIILFTGDLVNNFSYELDGWIEIFREINKSCTAYSILGNHDYGNYTNWESEEKKSKNFKAIVDAHKNFGFDLLRNDNRVINNGKDSIYFIGVENWGHPPFPQYADLERAMKGIPENAFEILLTHDPAHWNSQIRNKKPIELSFSGHTHGLQLGLVYAGIPFSLSYVVRENWGGLYNSENTYLYVNTGIGTVGIPWRIDMPGEITIVTLKRSKIN